jgi:tetratricopeptide (TPR) repeat protein
VRFFILAILLFGLAAVAAAETAPEAPILAPAPSWVRSIALPEASEGLSDRPIQPLLLAVQGRYSRDGRYEYHIRTANLAQTPEGLAALGNLVIPWQPAVAELIVNKVRIVRAGKEIDLLAAGQRFTVLRRENNLEGAALDGILTAALQPEGLAVGDVLDVAFTLRSRPRKIAFQPEDILMLTHGFPIRRIHYRQMWEKDVPIRWVATEAMGKPKVVKTDWGTEIVLDRENAEGPEPPTGAPLRFLQPARLELTGYGDWSDVSKLLAPVFDAAGELAPASPIRGEINRIAKASPDARQRAMAALRLVEDKVRYFALNIGDGGYVPASPDLTWSRKFGDCKGKTALLLALLKGLGIEAEPVLVSAAAGDSLGSRLPQLHAFDHVIVRARLGGRDYWLDGTRSGDRDLEALASTPFRWGLPLRVAGAKLEPLPFLPPALPLTESRVTYDASRGFFGAVPVAGETIYRGDMAIALRLMLQEAGAEEFRKRVREMTPDAPDGEDVQLDFKADEERGEFKVTFKGTQDMNWTGGPGARSMVFRFDSDTIRWTPDFRRNPATGADAPFALSFPLYIDSTETIILPAGGAGFVLEGKSFDRTVAGTRIARTISLEKGRAVAHSVFRRLQPETAAAEARSAEAALKEINADTAGVRATEAYQMPESDRKAMLAKEPADAAGYNSRGYEHLQDGSLVRALADFDKAASLSPKWSLPLANRGIALLHQNKPAEAKAALDKAAELGPDAVTWQGYGMLHLAEARPEQAVEALTRSLGLAPDNRFTLGRRVVAYQQLGKLREALADTDRILALKPDDRAALWERARLLAGLGETEPALAANSSLLELEPGNALYVGNRGELLSRLGRKDDALAAWAKAVAMIDAQLKAPGSDESLLLQQKISILMLKRDYKAAVAAADARLQRSPGNVPYLTLRCLVRAEGSIELSQARKDCDDAIRFDSGASLALAARGLVKLRLGQWDGAVADYSAALTIEARDYRSLYGRGLALLRKGDREAGERDLAAARRLSFDIDAEYAWPGLTP